MQEIADVYARSLFEVAEEHDILDEIRDELGQFADAMDEERDLQTFFFSPYFTTEEKRDGLDKMLEDPEEIFKHFLLVLVESHRMPVIFRLRRRFEEMWREKHRLLPVHVTSAIELDEDTVHNIGERIGNETGQEVELTSTVDPEILGGIVLRVGNSVLDASIRNRLEKLRKQVAHA